MKASSFLKIGVNYKLKIVHRVLNVHYINTCTYMLLNKKLWFLLTPIFKKLDAFIPALSLLANYYFSALLFCCLQQNEQKSSNITPPVCFFLLYYIYSKCMYFWVTCFMDFHWRQFSKSWTPSQCGAADRSPVSLLIFWPQHGMWPRQAVKKCLGIRIKFLPVVVLVRKRNARISYSKTEPGSLSLTPSIKAASTSRLTGVVYRMSIPYNHVISTW